MGVTVTSNVSSFQAALAAFVKTKLPKAVDTSVTTIASDVVEDITSAITTGAGGTPRRVDTGRYAAGWTEGAAAAGLPTSGLPSGPSKSGDGSGSVDGGDLDPRVVITNNVEYATEVEFGTSEMEAGNHVTKSLASARRTVPKETGEGSIQAEITQAWEK